MPGGSVNYLTRASSTVSGAEESTFFTVNFDPAALQAGSNTLAVEIHQRSSTSSDISFDLFLEGTDGSALLTRGPYLQLGTPTAITIRWRTDLPTDSVVSYGSSPGHLDNSVSDPALVTEHEMALSGLTADTTYYYSVGSSGGVLAGDDNDHLLTTAPVAGSVVPIRVWVLGDSGSANSNAAAVRDAYINYCNGCKTDIWLMLGDNAYTDGTDFEYQAAVFDMYPTFLRSTVLWLTLGNHDAHSADSPSESGPYYDIFTLPRNGEAGGLASGTEAYYSFDYGNVHFVCLDSQDTDRSPGGAMLTWLENDLASTMQDWIIAYWHHPPYTKGSHDSDNAADSGGRMRDMRVFALPILESHGVDLVMTGHSHSYERSFLLDGHYGTSGTLTPDMIIDDGDGREDGDGAYQKSSGLNAHEGTVYVVAGSSGKTSGGALNHPVMYLSLNRLGSLVVDINGDRLDAAFLDNAALVRDHFTIIKTDNCPEDLDGDGFVGQQDLGILLAAYMFNDGGDIDGDGDTDQADLGALLAVYDTSCP
ncbi:MAG TPA: metallophosphoesterase family protein [Phycisphaeraceae bacterium]|nr:metallophosphoesterase family protein [Phycisphaeraceae bacterium]